MTKADKITMVRVVLSPVFFLVVEPGIFFGLLYSRGGGRGRGCGGVGVHTGTAFHSDGADGLF